jgi:bifunctional DNA-binding transcriptional regulator/antitoxin component of YhaV-PrlF toxin-antitoxin module
MTDFEKLSKSDGFAEEAVSPYLVEPPVQRWRLKVGADGRVLIPAAARALMAISEDGIVNARVVDGQLQLTSTAVGIRRAQAIAAKYRKGTGSMVDALIAERREAAKQGD